MRLTALTIARTNSKMRFSVFLGKLLLMCFNKSLSTKTAVSMYKFSPRRFLSKLFSEGGRDKNLLLEPVRDEVSNLECKGLLSKRYEVLIPVQRYNKK